MTDLLHVTWVPNVQAMVYSQPPVDIIHGCSVASPGIATPGVLFYSLNGIYKAL